MINFDWYQATFYGDLPPADLLDRIAADLPRSHRVEHAARGKNGYSRTAILLDQEDHPLATMFHGGNRGAKPNIVASGPDAPAFAQVVRSLRLDHGVTRGDACQDMEGADFDGIVGDVKTISRRLGVKGVAWVPDDPETGPTHYAGRPTSDIRLRTYRKDLQLIGLGVSPAEFPQPIVRVEAQIRPRTKLRRLFAQLQPEAYFGASKLLRAVSAGILDNHPNAIVMQKRVPTSYDQQLRWLATQAHNALGAVLARHPGDEEFGRFIREYIVEGRANMC